VLVCRFFAVQLQIQRDLTTCGVETLYVRTSNVLVCRFFSLQIQIQRELPHTLVCFVKQK
jgi:hypothetical protein